MLWNTTFDAHPQFRTFWKAEKSLSIPCRHFLTSRSYVQSLTSPISYDAHFSTFQDEAIVYPYY
jgi:hypothetical protein